MHLPTHKRDKPTFFLKKKDAPDSDPRLGLCSLGFVPQALAAVVAGDRFAGSAELSQLKLGCAAIWGRGRHHGWYATRFSGLLVLTKMKRWQSEPCKPKLEKTTSGSPDFTSWLKIGPWSSLEATPNAGRNGGGPSRRTSFHSVT